MMIVRAIMGFFAGVAVGAGISAMTSGVDSGTWALPFLGAAVLVVALLDGRSGGNDRPRRPPPR